MPYPAHRPVEVGDVLDYDFLNTPDYRSVVAGINEDGSEVVRCLLVDLGDFGIDDTAGVREFFTPRGTSAEAGTIVAARAALRKAGSPAADWTEAEALGKEPA